MRDNKSGNNLYEVGGVLKRKRWTVIDVEDDVVITIKKLADKKGYTVATALKELVNGVKDGS